MPAFLKSTFVPARFFGPASCLCAAALACSLGFARPAHAVAKDDHQQAFAALSDIKAAITELVSADASFSTNKALYREASQRAINALVGAKSADYVAAAGTPGDPPGALGHTDALLDRAETTVWVAPLHGAEANIRGAVAHLHDALKARELMDYEIAASRAITYLEVAEGRPTQIGVFGGLEGALANTVLGIPSGARQEDACGTPSAAPSGAPAYGTHGGYIAWTALPASDGRYGLAEATGGTDVTVQSGVITLHTAAAKLVTQMCAAHAEAAHPATTAQPAQQQQAAQPAQPPPAPQPTQQAASPPAAKPASSATTALPALYTEAQAVAGKQIFMSKCVACHGANLQGTAAPSVAGTDFLSTAQRDGWNLWIIRYIVFTQMPRNAPATLSPEDSAKVMAFLLASDCYPAGKTPFPAKDNPDFKNIKLAPLSGHQPGENDKGVCEVK